jgi:mycothiol synthase
MLYFETVPKNMPRCKPNLARSLVMTITIERVTEQNQEQLTDYAARYGMEHDSSYLPGRDFEFSEQYPSYLLLQDARVVGAVCLMRTPRYLSVDRARFAVLHSLLDAEEAYSRLLDAVQPHLQDLKSVFLFIPQEKEGTAAILEGLGFQIERYSYVLQRDDLEPGEVSFPESYAVKAVEPGDRVGLEQFVGCLNEEFRELAGHTPNRVEELATWFEDETYLEGGLCLLKRDQEPVGTIAVMRDNDNPAAGEILAFGILKAQRGRNLGRILFRYGVNLAVERGLNPVTLSVNAENDMAIRLYLSEGFQVSEAIICYRLEIA